MAEYADIKAGLIERWQTIPALTNRVLGYEPTVPEPPMMYVLAESYTRAVVGQLTVMRWRVIGRLVIKWQEFERAELELDSYLNAIAAAVDSDAYLGGRINGGMAQVGDAKGGWMYFNGIQFRIWDTFVDVLDKAPYGSGI